MAAAVVGTSVVDDLKDVSGITDKEIKYVKDVSGITDKEIEYVKARQFTSVKLFARDFVTKIVQPYTAGVVLTQRRAGETRFAQRARWMDMVLPDKTHPASATTRATTRTTTWAKTRTTTRATTCFRRLRSLCGFAGQLHPPFLATSCSSWI